MQQLFHLMRIQMPYRQTSKGGGGVTNPKGEQFHDILL